VVFESTSVQITVTIDTKDLIGEEPDSDLSKAFIENLRGNIGERYGDVGIFAGTPGSVDVTGSRTNSHENAIRFAVQFQMNQCLAVIDSWA